MTVPPKEGLGERIAAAAGLLYPVLLVAGDDFMNGVGDASFIPPPLSRLWFIAASATLLRRTGERDRYPGYGADADR